MRAVRGLQFLLSMLEFCKSCQKSIAFVFQKILHFVILFILFIYLFIYLFKN